MQPPDPPKRIPVGAWVAIAAAALALMLTFRGGGKVEDAADEVPVYRTQSEANRGFAEAAELSIQPLKDFFAGDKLGEPQVAALHQARRLLKGVVAYDPKYFATFVAVGRISVALEDYPEAERYLREAVRLAPDPPTGDWKQIEAETHYLLSRTLYQTKSFAAAIDEADLAITLAPDNPDNFVARASALLQVGKVDEAKEALDRALALNPQVPGGEALRKLIEIATANS